MWTNDQRNRFGLENQWLKYHDLDQFSVYHQQRDDTYYASGIAASSSGRNYKLYVCLPSGYPNARPSMYLTDPLPLYAYDGTRISSLGTSHHMHILSPSPQGHVQLCHWRDNRWHAGILLYKVFLKGLLWIEAYEQHLATGKNISEFVSTMKEAA